MREEVACPKPRQRCENGLLKYDMADGRKKGEPCKDDQRSNKTDRDRK
ncbi:hypothetical protein J4462_03730 [Candidatus Pacearchaeota archaeon]|nr:hypothetical protein [Candidatus Pacearchaeota archaeon]